ncbi:unnamed protein product [Brassica oleracea]
MNMLTATVFKFCVSRTLSTSDEINAMLLQLSGSLFKASANQYAQCGKINKQLYTLGLFIPMQWLEKTSKGGHG